MTTAWRSEDLDADAARWAMSPAGLALLDELVADHDQDPLKLATRLRDGGLEAAHAAAVQGIATASRRARGAGHPDGTWWTPAAAEQASRPEVARWRARRFDRRPTVDLTAGCGADSLALADVCERLLATDASPVRLPLLRANLPADVGVVRADAMRPCVTPGEWWAWSDPDRRDGGRRLRGLGDLRPAVPALVDAGWGALGVAVSPAVDLGDPDRPADAELEFVQVGRSLVEAALWCGDARETGPGAPATASATLLPDGLHERGEPVPPVDRVAEPDAWLAVPAPALVRARLADRVAARHGLVRLARHRALWSGPTPTTTPWFRCERIEAVVAARPGRVKDALRGLEERPVEVVAHGLRIDPTAWWRGIGAPPRGPGGRAVHVARLDAAAVAIITRRDAEN